MSFDTNDDAYVYDTGAYDTGPSDSAQGNRKGLPNNTEAEANVLAAMLLSEDVVDDALLELRAEDFYRPAHRTIFNAMREMYDASIPIDSISLIDHLKSTDKLAAVGGEAYILELVGNTISLVNWQHHASIVRRDAMLRDIIGATNQINALAYNAPEDTKEVIEQSESMLLSVTEREVQNSYRPLSDYLIEAYDEAEEISKSKREFYGVRTEFPSLDNLLLGLRDGQLVVVGARPAIGKTSFALNLALNAAADGYTVAFFSLEMSGKEIAQRFICMKASVSLTKLRSGRIDADDWAKISEATEKLSKLDILIDDTSGTTVTEIRAKARRMLHGKEKRLVILDYLQLLSSPPNKNYRGNRVLEVSDMSRGLKIMAKELNVPVVMLSQLSRQVETRTGKRPQLSDLRESGSIEQDADIVLLLDRSTSEQEAQREDRPGENVTRVIVAKNRSGPTGDVDLMFMPASTKFYELSEQEGV